MTANTKLFDGIVIFTHVVNSGGFSAAAELTGHSTSYISKEINKLEARLGVRLLNRTTRSISLTPEGELYFQQCQQLVFDAESTVGEITSSHVNPKGMLKISCPVSFGLGHLQPILSEYMSMYPEVQLHMDFNDRKVDVVQDGYDLVIRATRDLDESSLVCRKIYQAKAYTVASPAYLRKHGRPEHPEELVNHACICYSNHKTPTRWIYQLNTGNCIIQIDV